MVELWRSRLSSCGIFISQLVRFARYCTNVLDFYSKNLQITSKLLTQGNRYHRLRKTFGFFRSYSELLSKFGDISFQEYVPRGISHLIFYDDLVYKQTWQRATLLLLTWIYFCRSGGTVNFTLPFMTNVTISISTSQIFRSWVAIFQHRPPMASLFRS